jgi:hypothetical protein
MKLRISLTALIAVGTLHLAVHGAPALPRTPWGTPDLQGVTWNFATMTPLERPRDVNVAVFSAADAATFERATTKRNTDNNNNGPDWWDEGSSHLDRRRTSLITDPPDGHVPAMLPAAQAAFAANQAHLQRKIPEGPEDYPLNARCVWWQNAGPPMIPSPYNNNVQFIQTRDYVVISNENIHDARIVPTDGRPHGSIRRWAGDSRGHWEGDALVVDTVNFTDKTTLRGSDSSLHLVERFTRIDVDTLEYRFTVEDPTVWSSQSWTAMLLMRGTNEPILEFSCHEGNFNNMQGLLHMARFDESAGK